VEARYNTSTVARRAVGGAEKGTQSHMRQCDMVMSPVELGAESDSAARPSSNCRSKLQIRLLVREGAQYYKKTANV
jgi:hypothetical protein